MRFSSFLAASELEDAGVVSVETQKAFLKAGILNPILWLPGALLVSARLHMESKRICHSRGQKSYREGREAPKEVNKEAKNYVWSTRKVSFKI